jgi:hypothetical protein
MATRMDGTNRVSGVPLLSILSIPVERVVVPFRSADVTATRTHRMDRMSAVPILLILSIPVEGVVVP